MSITVKREDLPSYQDAYGKVATAHISDSDIEMAKLTAESKGQTVEQAMAELKDRVNKVQYAAGKNYNRILAAINATNKLYDSMLSSYSDSEYDAFQKQRVALCEQFSKKDKDGNPEFKPTEQDGREYVIEKSVKDEFVRVMAELKEEFEDAIERFKANVKEAQDIGQKEITIPLHHVPWTYRPNAISGAYVALVVDMFTGAPTLDEVLDDVDENDNEKKGLQESERSV